MSVVGDVNHVKDVVTRRQSMSRTSLFVMVFSQDE